MKCSECKYLLFEKGNGNPNRYYCKNSVISEKRLCGAVMICRCDRGSEELKIKTSPKWCPLKSKEQ